MATAEINLLQNSDTIRAERLIPWGSLLLTLFALIISVSPETIQLLQFDRVKISQGQIWRILTGHFTHCSPNHLFWDVIVFFVLGSICEKINRKDYFVCLMLSSVCISLGVLVFLPDMELYRGLSGIDSAMFVFLLVEFLKRKYKEKDFVWIFFVGLGLFCFISKLLFEIISGQTLFVQNTGTMIPVPLAHLIGGIAGIISNITFLQPSKLIKLF